MTDSNPLPSDQLDQLFAAPEVAPVAQASPRQFQATLPTPAAADAPPELRAPVPKKIPLIQFEELLFKLTRFIWVTPACLIANVAFFAYMVSQGVHYFLPDAADLLKWGANYGPYTWSGQPWRLLTSMFIHCGVLHLAFNMWALWSAGRMFERLVGGVGFFIIYFASGIAGGVASTWWNGDIVSAGASGAIFGILGAFASFIWNRRDSFPVHALSQLRGSLASCIGYNLLFGASIPGIDQAAHIGGLLCGLILGFVVSQPLDQFTAKRRIGKNLLAGIISLLVLGALIVKHPPPPPDLLKEWVVYEEVVPPAIQKFKDAAQKFDDRKLTAKELITLVEKDILPDWDRVRKHMDGLQNIPNHRRELLNRARTQLMVREESWKLLVEAFRKNDPSKMNAYKDKWKQAEQIQHHIEQL